MYITPSNSEEALQLIDRASKVLVRTTDGFLVEAIPDTVKAATTETEFPTMKLDDYDNVLVLDS